MASAMGSFLCPPGFAGPTGVRALVREGSAVSEAARYVGRRAHRRLHGATAAPDLGGPRQVLEPVVLVPGFLAGDGTLALMAAELRGLGYRTYRSRMHANVGCTQDALTTLERRIEGVVARRGSKVSIVGHSLGGLIARGLAARRPDLVAGIVTLGSPVLAPGAAHPLLLFDLRVLAGLQRAGKRVGLGGLMGEDCTSGECARTSWELARRPLPTGVAFTSVFSRRDGVVDWRSCLDPQASAVEVSTSHLGMAFDPRVLDVVTAALVAGRDGRRRPRRPPAASVRRARSAAAPDASAGWPPAASR
jgi:triacylglycerol lipase